MAEIGNDCVFALRLGDEESKSRFNTRDFAFITVVNDNRRMYTSREVKQVSKVA